MSSATAEGGAEPLAPSGEHKQSALRIFPGLGRRYDLISELFSFGQDPRWRRFAVERTRAGPESRVLDVAAGTGKVSTDLVDHYGCRVVALDQSPQMLAELERKAQGPRYAGRIETVMGEAERLPFPDASFDALTFTYLLRYVEDVQGCMEELARVVKPGGTISYLEFHVPPNPAWNLAWRLYCRIGLPTLGGLVSEDWRAVGAFLGPSIRSFYERHPLPELLRTWERAGIEHVDSNVMSLGGGVVIWGVRAGSGAPVS